MKEIDGIKNRIRNKEVDKKSSIKYFLFKTFLLIIIFFILMLIINKNQSLKNTIYNKVYNSNIKFAKVKNIYNKYLGDILPFSDYMNEKKVFKEKLEFISSSKYNKGVKLKVTDNYLVPAIKGGIVIFQGKRDKMNTVIVQQSDGIDAVYQNFSNVNVNLYDYVDDNGVLGEVKDNLLYLTFKKDGVEIDYKKVIK